MEINKNNDLFFSLASLCELETQSFTDLLYRVSSNRPEFESHPCDILTFANEVLNQALQHSAQYHRSQSH